MCLAIPGKILKIKKNNQAIVDFNGLKKEINLCLVKAKENDYVIVHAGFAIQKLLKKDGFEVLKLYENYEKAKKQRNKRDNRKNKLA